MKFSVALLFLNLCFQNSLFAQEKVSVEDRIIGSTLKGLARAFVAIVDMDTLKKNNIDKLNKMSEAKFSKQYAKVYEVIKDLPDKFKNDYGVAAAMSKAQAIKNIKLLNKEKTYKIIDSIPDTIIAKQFKRYLEEKKQAIQKSNTVEQIKKFWNRMLSRIDLLSKK
jgi:uncharacterized protein with NAD-binding domain and iron-sulfur cluster